MSFGKSFTMKNSLTAFAAVATAYATAAGFGAVDAAMAADVTVNIDGVRAGDGALYISVQTEDQFMQDEGAYGQVVSDPGEGALSVTISGVDNGNYAVSVWHDDNGNQEFDSADNGMPLDGWSMSGSAGRSGPPTFEDAKVTVDGDTGVALEMVYGR